jgi:hypothetical protein
MCNHQDQDLISGTLLFSFVLEKRYRCMKNHPPPSNNTGTTVRINPCEMNHNTVRQPIVKKIPKRIVNAREMHKFLNFFPTITALHLNTFFEPIREFVECLREEVFK